MALRWNLTRMNNLLRVVLMSLIPAVTTPAAADAPKSAPAQEAAQDSLHTLSAKSIDGKSVSFADYKGKVCLLYTSRCV